MKCQRCGHDEASVHLTDIVNKKKRELHLCESCARDQQLIPEGSAPQQLNLQALVQLIMGQPTDVDPAGLTCPTCGLKYAAFRADGRLGCADDYDIFRAALVPLLDRIHRGTHHNGKVPRHAQHHAAIVALQEQLRVAITAENYEDAATLRDRIRQAEGSNG